ncbi:MAG TPA: two-component regulator propeller domain-containing protein, partial [Bacteroidales bacterium]|nr:two-component regulator propeller domain-containing protein [Bacteroidales bacterium]
MRRILLYLSFLLSPFSFLLSQPLRFSPVPGQPTSIVTSLMQDSRGFVWMATMSGLYRYDGYEFRKFTYDPGDTASYAPITLIGDLLEDSQGFIWISTYDNLLIRYDRHTET